MDPLVSIVILNYMKPEVIEICLKTLAVTEGVPYEVVVVDNGSGDETVHKLREFKEQGYITTLVENPGNYLYAKGNNIGVENSNPNSEYILLLNSDVAFLRSDWLEKLVGWAEGTTKYWPSLWNFKPTQPSPGPRDVVSAGWSHDGNVAGNARPEGFCCLIRRSVWRNLDEQWPWLYCIDEMLTSIVRQGAKLGVLFNYAPYFIHREGASGKPSYVDTSAPKLEEWYSDVLIETLDFTLGPDEHDSYLCW